MSCQLIERYKKVNVVALNRSFQETKMDEDRRLDKLYDYTKWHIGIYLSATGALTAGLSYLARHSNPGSPIPLGEHPWLLVVSILSMLSAGMCGGIVASSCTESRNYDELWNGMQGPYNWKLCSGRIWARLEHGFFWTSVLSLILWVFSAQSVRRWLF